jgi:hypothetical protein
MDTGLLIARTVFGLLPKPQRSSSGQALSVPSPVSRYAAPLQRWRRHLVRRSVYE